MGFSLFPEISHFVMIMSAGHRTQAIIATFEHDLEKASESRSRFDSIALNARRMKIIPLIESK
nr:hypothetical protein [Hyphomonas sp. Mor2]